MDFFSILLVLSVRRVAGVVEWELRVTCLVLVHGLDDAGTEEDQVVDVVGDLLVPPLHLEVGRRTVLDHVVDRGGVLDHHAAQGLDGVATSEGTGHLEVVQSLVVGGVLASLGEQHLRTEAHLLVEDLCEILAVHACSFWFSTRISAVSWSRRSCSKPRAMTSMARYASSRCCRRTWLFSNSVADQLSYI